MFCARKQRRTGWLALLGCLCVPLAALGWSAPASADNPSVSILVVSSANPSTFGEDVTYTATLTTSDSGSLLPTDQMGFLDNGTTIVNCNSQTLMGTETPGTYVATCDEPANSLSVGRSGMWKVSNDLARRKRSSYLATHTILHLQKRVRGTDHQYGGRGVQRTPLYHQTGQTPQEMTTPPVRHFGFSFFCRISFARHFGSKAIGR